MPSDPHDVGAYEKMLAKTSVIGPQRLSSPIEIREYDPIWPTQYAKEAEAVRRILGDRVVRLEHVGSTSVANLPAKPIIDMVVEVPDSSDEPAYLPDLERGGYVLSIREPEWYQHRVFKGPVNNINLHVFSADCPETDRMVAFRDWLRTNDADRHLYASVKKTLASQDWTYVQQYADAKGDVVGEIFSRIVGLGGQGPT